MTHALKTEIVFFKDIVSGTKTFEVRKYDRPFKLGDALLLQEWDAEVKVYTGKNGAVALPILWMIQLSLKKDFAF